MQQIRSFQLFVGHFCDFTQKEL